jgi:hypothetical protein
MINKKIVVFFCLGLLVLPMYGQTVKVKKEKTRIKNEYADGFEVELQGTAEEVESSLTKLMKSFGKSKTVENYIVVNEPLIREKKYTTPVYGVNKQVGNIISAWVGFNSDDFSKNDQETLNSNLEKIVYDFGVNFYREKIQKQIDESVRAATAVQRQQQRLQTQNRNLNTKIEDNKREKIQLEKSIEKNRIELETLTKQLEKNKKDQDSVAVAGEQINKVLDLQREKQRKVN